MRVLATLAVLLLVAACQAVPPEMTEDQNQEVQVAITSLLDDLADAVKDLDVERYLTLFKEGDAFTFVQDGVETRTWDGYAELKRSVWGGVETVDRFEYDHVVQVLDGGTGVGTMIFSMTATTPTGDVLEGSGTYTAVCAEENGEWKVVNGGEYFVLTGSGVEVALSDAGAEQAIKDQWALYSGLEARTFDDWTALNDPDLWILEPGMDIRGDEVEQFGRDFFGSGGQVVSIDVETMEAFAHGDVAYEIGRYSEIIPTPEGLRTDVYKNFFARWKKQPAGDWRIDRWVGGNVENPVEG